MIETLSDSSIPTVPHEEVVASRQDYETFVSEWSDRALQIHIAPEEQPTLTADGRGLHFDKLTIYHGSPVPGIENMDVAEEHTIGKGIYGTYDPTGAIGYGLVRSHSAKGDEVDPVLYELEADDVSLIDLREPEAITTFLTGFKPVLEERLKLRQEVPLENPSMNYFVTKVLQELISSIDEATSHPRILLKDMTRSGLLNDYVESLGFQGVIGLEGGESSGQHTIGAHESWVIFDPAKVTVTAEASFVDPNPPAPRPEEPARLEGQWWD